MSSHYDKFDYPAYWQGREYEHKAELIALSGFFSSIKKIKYLLEIGGGYGRLVPSYIYRAKKVYLTDSSAKLISIAKKTLRAKNVTFLQSSISVLPKKFRPEKFDVIIMVRVLHHIKNVEDSFQIIHKLLKPKGYLILEFANKIHLKSIFKEILKGNFTAFYDIFPKDIRSIKSIKKHSISFNNYHPAYIIEYLEKIGFNVVETRSVSNIRNKYLKSHIPVDVLLSIESVLQKIFSRIYFGPSTFILARKIS